MRLASNRILASLIGAIGVVLWATETSLITYTSGVPPLQTVAIAFVFASVLSPVMWWVTGESPLVAFKQPLAVWLLTVGSLVTYHACIYYATQKASPAAAALLQGTTPLMIVIGSALLPGERLRWWHVAGVFLGLLGILRLIDAGSDTEFTGDTFYLALVGIAAALWGLYSLTARALPDVPSSALGVFYGASAALSFTAHLGMENWVQPTTTAWFAIAALGIFPMGLAIYFWDFGLKRGDIQALGAFSYVEPFIGAALVSLFAGQVITLSLLWSGVLVIGGATLASAGLWMSPRQRLFDAPEDASVESVIGGWTHLNDHSQKDIASSDCRCDLHEALNLFRLRLDSWKAEIHGSPELSRNIQTSKINEIAA